VLRQGLAQGSAQESVKVETNQHGSFHTPGYMESFHTPANDNQRMSQGESSLTRPDSATPQETDVESPSRIQSGRKKQLRSSLAKHGMTTVDGRIVFKDGKKIVDYAQATVDKVMHYLTSEKIVKMPHNGGKLVNIVYDHLKNETDDFNSMLKNCPNLKMFHQSKLPLNFNDWEDV
jgi:hypothetical protein